MKKFALFLALLLLGSSSVMATDTQQSRKQKTRTTNRASSSSSRSSSSNKTKSSEVPSWIYGNWHYTTYIMGQRFECRVGITEDKILVMSNGERLYYGSFTIEGDKLIYDRHPGEYYSYILLDRANKRLKADSSTPFYRF